MTGDVTLRIKVTLADSCGMSGSGQLTAHLGLWFFIEILQFAHVPGISPWSVEVVWIELH